MPKFLLIDIKTNLVKLYMGILILLFGGMFIFGVSNLNHERVTQYIELIIYYTRHIVIYCYLFCRSKQEV